MTLDEADQLVVGEHLGLGQPVQALGRHAVGAAQVAPVGDRDTQVTSDATEASRAVAGREGRSYATNVRRRTVSTCSGGSLTPRWLGALLLAGSGGGRATTWAGGIPPPRGQGTCATSGSTSTTAPTPCHCRRCSAPPAYDPDDEWTRVTVTGKYDGNPVFVRGRTVDERAGLGGAVGAAPRCRGSPAVVVDRGFVAAVQRGRRAAHGGRRPRPETWTVTWAGCGVERPRKRQEVVAGPGGEHQRAGRGRRARASAVRTGVRAAGVGGAPTAPPPATPGRSGSRTAAGAAPAYAYQWWFLHGSRLRAGSRSASVGSCASRTPRSTPAHPARPASGTRRTSSRSARCAAWSGARHREDAGVAGLVRVVDDLATVEPGGDDVGELARMAEVDRVRRVRG